MKSMPTMSFHCSPARAPALHSGFTLLSGLYLPAPQPLLLWSFRGLPLATFPHSGSALMS